MRKARSGATIAERLEYYSIPEPNSGCVIWIGSIGSSGYGSLGAGRSGKLIRAHRAAWELKNGPIPTGMVLCHHCDNRLCVNPDHLFVGTVADNNLDMIRKGRKYTMPRAIPDDVVLALRLGAVSNKAVMAQFGVSPSVISRAINGKGGYSRVSAS
jgi:hypothetical protein